VQLTATASTIPQSPSHRHLRQQSHPILTRYTHGFNAGASFGRATAAFINGAQVLVNGVAVPTTFNNGGQLTANFNATVPAI